MALQQVLCTPRRFDELLDKVNKGALRSAMNKILSNKQHITQFTLFAYDSGIRVESGNGFRVEQLVPGTTIPIADYVYSEEFYNELIGKGVPELQFRLWSRYASGSKLVRELMLEIKRATFKKDSDKEPIDGDENVCSLSAVEHFLEESAERL